MCLKAWFLIAFLLLVCLPANALEETIEVEVEIMDDSFFLVTGNVIYESKSQKMLGALPLSFIFLILLLVAMFFLRSRSKRNKKDDIR